MIAPAVLGRRVHLVGPWSAAPAPFEEIYALDDPQWARQAFDTARLLQRALGTGDVELDEIARFASHQPGWGVAERYSPTLTQERDRAGEMIARVQNALLAYFGMPLSEHMREQFNATIAFAFINLATQRQAAWLSFMCEAGGGTRYRYCLLFALHSAATGSSLCLAPVVLDIRINRDFERAQLVTVKDEIGCSVRIDALKLFMPRPRAAG